MGPVRSGDAALHVESSGAGEPVTVLGHGLGGSIAETRPLAGGVPGTRVFLSFRGHQGSAVPDPATAGWGIPDLAADLRAVADAAAATRAVGVSMGASALLHLLAATPHRFDRCVLFLPAVLDRPRHDAAVERLAETARLVDAGDPGPLAEHLVRELPARVGDLPAARAYAQARAASLVGTQVAWLLRSLPRQHPLADRSVLAAVSADCLVLAQRDDPLHPVDVAEEIASALPSARLHVFDEPALWVDRARLRGLVGDFLSAR